MQPANRLAPSYLEAKLSVVIGLSSKMLTKKDSSSNLLYIVDKSNSRTFHKDKCFYSFIHMCIQCSGHLSPLPPTPPSSPQPPLASRQNLFCTFLQFYWSIFASYTERFLALFPCTSVLQPKLIHL
jgi:hypothetical protein